jgi:hypothetical protein
MVSGLLLLPAGCSAAGKDADAPGVASLRSAAPAGSSAAGAQGERPVVPIDATDDEIEAIGRPWLACLLKEGGSKYRTWTTVSSLKKGVDETDPVMKTCLPKFPETVQSHLERTDMSAYRDNEREFYQCAEREGYKLNDPDPVTGEFGLAEIGPDGDAGSPKFLKCERDAFAS